MPGVGYVEMAFAASSGRALAAVAFLRPCVLSGPGRGERSVLRCTRRAGALEIASARGTGSSSFASCFAGTLANIESGYMETVSGRSFEACNERFIRTASRRRNPLVPQATVGPRPRVLELSSRIGGTAWTFSARKSLCSASGQLSRRTSRANVASINSERTKHMARWQSCKSLGCTVLSRSRVLSYQAHNDK